LPRGNYSISHEDDLDVVNDFIPITAKVYNTASLSGITNVNCSFYFDNNYIGYNLTNASGYCVYYYDKTVESIGAHNITVNISEIPGHIIDINEMNHTININQWLTDIEIGNQRSGPGAFYYKDDIASVYMNITRNGTFTNVTNLTLMLTDQLDVVVETLYLENTTCIDSTLSNLYDRYSTYNLSYISNSYMENQYITSSNKITI